MAKTQRRNRKGAAPRKASAAVKRRARAAGTRPAAKSRAAARKTVKARPAAKKVRKPARSVAAKARSAKRAVKKTVRKATAARRVAKKTVRKVVKKATTAVRRVAKVAAPIASKRAPAPKKVAAATPKKVAAAPKKVVVAKGATPAKKPAAAVAAQPVRKAPALDRERRTVGEPEMVPMPPSSLIPGHASAARSGADELRMKMATHTGAGPVLTAGDVDADWGAAEAVGDEAPGGDNPTPDQDVVDEIGRALGVEYDDDEELQGGDEIAGRDRDRWELDPASSDDFDER